MRPTTWLDVVVVAVALGALVGLTTVVLNNSKITDATGVAAVLGVILPHLAAIAAAVFGVSLAAKAKTAEDEANKAKTDKAEAETKLKKKTELGKEIQDILASLNVDKPLSLIETFGSSQSNSDKYSFGAGLQQDTIMISDINSTRKSLADLTQLSKQLTE